MAGAAAPSTDPLKKCPRGCLFDAKQGHNYCPWHGRPLESVIGTRVAESFVIKQVVSGAGGFGVVYYARSEIGDNIEAAVKVLRPNACYDENAIRDFIAEADRTFNLLKDCPNAAKVLGVNRKPFPFILMDYVNGGSLYSWLSEVRAQLPREEGQKRKLRPKLIPWSRACSMLEGIARALEYAHGSQIVHRDLKPQNVLIDSDGDGRETVKVVDWGISIARRATRRRKLEPDKETMEFPTRTITDAESGRLRRQSQQFTPKYTPPEVFRNILQEKPEERDLKEVFDPRTDVYQFGLLAFELITGEFPFPLPPEGATDEERFNHWREQHCRVGGAAPFKVKRFRGDLRLRSLPISTRKKRLLRAINCCLEKQPAKRYKTGAELRKALTERPVLETVGLYGLFSVLVVLLALWLGRGGGSAPSQPDFFKNWDKQTAGISAREESEGIQTPEGTKYSVWRIWTRSLDDLASRNGKPLIYTSPDLGSSMGLGKVNRVYFERWRIPDGASQEETALVQPLGDWDGIADTMGSSVMIRLGELVDRIRREEPSEGPFTFSLKCVFGEKTTYVNFFQIVIDAEPPSVALEQLVLVAPGSPFDGKGWKPVQNGGKPRRIYVPAGVQDLKLRCDFTAKDNRDPRLQVKAQFLGRVEILDPKESSFFVPAPAATAQGTPLALEISATDQAGRTGGEKEFLKTNTSRWDLILDSGPGVVQRGAFRREPGGVGVLRIEVEPKVDPMEAKSYRFSWSPAGENARKDAVVEWDAKEGNVKIDAGEFAANFRAGGTLRLSCVQMNLEYPGGAPLDQIDPTSAGSVAQELDIKVDPERVIKASDFEIHMDLKEPVRDKTLRPRAGKDGEFIWRAMRPERFPSVLTLRTENAFELDIEKARWSLGGKAVQGPECEVKTQLGKNDLDIDLEIDVETYWGTVKRLGARLEYRPQLRLFRGVEAVENGGNPRAVFAGQDPRGANEMHARSLQRLSFLVGSDVSDLSEKGVSLRVSPPLGSGFGSSRNQGGMFQLELQNPEGKPLPEGIYELTFSAVDEFENGFEEKRYLYIHEKTPAVFVANVECDQKVPLPPGESGSCDVIVNVEDISGIRELEAGGLVLVSDGVTRVNPGVRFREVKCSLPRAICKLVLVLEGRVPGGQTQDVEVEALDDPAGALGKTRCKVGITCTEKQLPRLVTWLGLRWRYVEGVPPDGGFYVTECEVPKWFYDGKGNAQPPPDDDRGWAPKTGVSPKSVVEWTGENFKDRPVYLPTFDEWQQMARSEQGATVAIADGVNFQKFLKPLEKFVNSGRDTPPDIKAKRDASQLVPANYAPKGNDPSLFYGLLHLLGNAEEIVQDGEKYRAVGGSAGVALRNCIEKGSAQISIRDDNKPDPTRGFRLVVYITDPQPNTARSNRQRNAKFLELITKP